EADVVEHGHPRHEREVLEHHHAIHAGLLDLPTFEDHTAGRSALETGDDVEQRALTASGVADHRDEFALLDLEAHVSENADLAAALRRREELRHRIDLEVAHSVYASRRDRRLRPASSSTPITPIARIAKITLVRARLFHSFQTKYPIPVPPISISAATIATHALPIEMRRPATIAGAAAGKITVTSRRHKESWRIAATLR